MLFIVGLVLMLIGIVFFFVETLLILYTRKKGVAVKFWAIEPFQKMPLWACLVLRLLIFLLFLQAIMTWDDENVGSGIFCFYSAWCIAMTEMLYRALRTGRDQ